MARTRTLQETLPAFLRVARRFWPHLQKERRLIIVSVAALFAEIGLRLLEPWPLKFVFDFVLIPNETSSTPSLPSAGGLDSGTLLVVSAVAVVVFTGLRAGAAYVNTVGFTQVGNRVLTQVRGQLYAHLQNLSLSFHTKARSGDLVVRVISDVSQLKDVAVTALIPLVAHSLVLVGMLVLMLFINWQLTLLAMLTFPLLWLSTMRFTKRISDAARKQRKREGAMAAAAAESISAIKTVQALSLETSLAGSFQSQNQESLKQDARAARLSASLERSVDVVIAIATGLVLWYGANLVLSSQLTPGDLLVFLTYLKNAFKPLRDSAKYTGRLAKATAAGERVLDVLERDPDVRDLPGAVPAPALSGAVGFRNVSFEYEPGHPVFRNVDLHVAPGTKVALAGPSGHGKSTLVGMLLRLYDPIKGSVMLDEHDIREYTLESVRAQVSVVLQDTVLFAASARDNIAYGAPNATEEEIEWAARLANAHDFISALPDGYDTVLGERGSTLSNGQRQRISIARAAIRRSPILILDEPTTGLDEHNEREVMEALDRLMVGKTTFLITHKLEQMHHADLIVVLAGGRIVHQGTPEEIEKEFGSLASVRLRAKSIDTERQSLDATDLVTIYSDESYILDPEELANIRESLAQGTTSPTFAFEPIVGQSAEGAIRQRVWSMRANSRTRALGPALLMALVLLGLAAAFIPTVNGGSGTNSALSATRGQLQIAGREVVTYTGHLTGAISLDWAANNRTLAIGATDGGLHLLDTATGAVTDIDAHKGALYSVAWSHNGQMLATAGEDRLVRLWMSNGSPAATLAEHSGSIPGLAWLPNGQMLTSASSSLDLYTWDSTGKQLSTSKGQGDFLVALSLSPDGKTFATGSNDETVRLWNVDGALIKNLYGHTGGVYTVDWSPDGQLLASGADDETVRLWSNTGDEVATLVGHEGFVNSISWSPNGEMLASVGAGDKTARIWSRDGTLREVLLHTEPTLTVGWSPDGRTLSVITANNSIWLWQMNSTAP